jgi:predicted glycosyltransferase
VVGRGGFHKNILKDNGQMCKCDEINNLRYPSRMLSKRSMKKTKPNCLEPVTEEILQVARKKSCYIQKNKYKEDFIRRNAQQKKEE